MFNHSATEKTISRIKLFRRPVSLTVSEWQRLRQRHRGPLHAGYWGTIRRYLVRPSPKYTSPDNAANFRLSGCRNSVGTPANLTYLRSAASCCCVCLSAAFTAARNESLLAGARTSPDSVSRKETFFP